MANTIQFLRTVTPGATPPVVVKPGEPVAILDAVGRVDLYVGDTAGTPILINPSNTPIGGIEFKYRWERDQDVSTAPAAGDIKIDGDQDPTGATTPSTMSVHKTTRNGVDTAFFWPLVLPGDVIGLFETGGGGGAGGESFHWLVAGPAVLVGQHYNIPGSVTSYSGNDIDNNRPTAVFYIPDPANVTDGDLVSDPNVTDNLVQPIADHPAMRFQRIAGQTTNVVEFQDELGNVAGGFTIIGTQAAGDLGVVWDAGIF